MVKIGWPWWLAMSMALNRMKSKQYVFHSPKKKTVHAIMLADES
jgi:hypothetical protein